MAELDYLNEYEGTEDQGLEGLGGSALTGNAGDTSVDYSNIGTTMTQGASAGSVAGPYGALIGGVAGGLLGTTQDVLAVYNTDDNARKAVDSYMNSNKSNSPPNVLPSAPLYMNKWFIIGGLGLLGSLIGTGFFKYYLKKRKLRHA